MIQQKINNRKLNRTCQYLFECNNLVAAIDNIEGQFEKKVKCSTGGYRKTRNELLEVKVKLFIHFKTVNSPMIP